MVVSLQASYDAYDDKYAADRVADPLFGAKLVDTLISLGRQKTREELDDHIGEETFKEQVRVAVGPLVFPLHVGNAKDHTLAHEESGLLPGRSGARATSPPRPRPISGTTRTRRRRCWRPAGR